MEKKQTHHYIDPDNGSLIQHLHKDGELVYSFEMVKVKGGSFMMGSESNEARSWEKPEHQVHIKDFYLGRFLVSQELWMALMEENRSFYQDMAHPVERVSWEDCQAFLKRLNKKTGLSYRLPSEAEWEYAARGGAKSFGTKYAGSGELKEVGWHYNNSGWQTHLSALKRGNKLGICDMSGNLYERCEDRWHGNYKNAPDDGSSWEDGNSAPRVIRGGNWASNSESCRVSYRRHSPQFRGLIIGFRLALSPESVG